MAESEGVGYIFGLSTVLIGLTTIMSMGVFSAYHPYKPGQPATTYRHIVSYVQLYRKHDVL